MFLLKDLPDEAIFRRFKEEYPDLDIPSTALFLRLLRVGSDLLNTLDNFLKDYDLTHGRWITLILLNREKNKMAMPSVLAEKQGVTRATITNLLNKLDRDGLIRRIPCDQDGRSSQIKLTQSGKSKLDTVMPHYYRMVRDLFNWAEPDDVELTTDFLDHVLEVLKSAEAP